MGDFQNKAQGFDGVIPNREEMRVLLEEFLTDTVGSDYGLGARLKSLNPDGDRWTKRS